MKKLFVTFVICLMATVSSFAQHNISYYNRYGSSIGSQFACLQQYRVSHSTMPALQQPAVQTCLVTQ